ncbi:MAG: hypothetical protein H0X39_00915 [Actinobacteria bacterium]|nr:hypothetical protein [Actinomycetota bacterium]
MSALAWASVEDAIQAWITAGSGLASDHVVWAQQTAPRPVGEFISLRMTVFNRSGRDWRAREDNPVPIGPLAVTAQAGNSLTVTAHGLVTGQGPLTVASTGTATGSYDGSYDGSFDSAGAGAVPGGLTPGVSYWPVVINANTLQLAATFQLAVAASPTVIALSSAGTGTVTISGTTFVPGAEVTSKLRGPRQAILTLQCFAGAPTGGGATGVTSPFAILNDAISSYALETREAALSAAGIGIGWVESIQSIDGVVNTVRFEPRAIATVHLHLASEIVETSTYIQIVNATDQIPAPPTSLTVIGP